MTAIDTNVLIYSVDPSDQVKHTKAREVIRQLFASRESTVLPYQVAVEYLAKLRKWQSAGKLRPDEVRARYTEFLAAWVIAIPSVQVLRLALDYHERYSLSHWDSLLLAACREAGVTRLLSEDMQAGATYDGVEVVNPLA
jgi:predicted nucleic acid-binding protein